MYRSAVVGEAFSASPIITANGYYDHITYSLGSPGLGLSVNSSTGVLSGTPTGAGTVTVRGTVYFEDGTTLTASPAAVSVLATGSKISSVGQVNPANTAVTQGVAITPVTLTPTVSPTDDGTYSYEWEWGGSEPVGLTLTPAADGKTCVVAGTTSVGVGTYWVQCNVTDAYGTTKGSTNAYGRFNVAAPTTLTELLSPSAKLREKMKKGAEEAKKKAEEEAANAKPEPEAKPKRKRTIKSKKVKTDGSSQSD